MKRSAAPVAGWLRCGAILAGALALAFSGCIVIPMNDPVSSSRQNVTEDTQRELKVGETTKEQVILRFGEPDRISADCSRLGYTQSRQRAFWLLVGAATGGGIGGGVMGGEVTRDSLLLLTFDENNRLLKSEFRKGWNEDFKTWEEGQENIKGSSRLVLLQPRLQGSGPVTPTTHPLKVAVLPTIDQRVAQDRVGEWKVLGIGMGAFRSSGSLGDFLRQELIAEIALMGHTVSDQRPDVTITPRLSRVWFVGRPTAGLDWEITSEVGCDLIYSPTDSPDRPVTRHYSGRVFMHTAPVTERLAEFYGRVLNDTLDDMMAKMRKDDIWRSWSAAKLDP